VNAFVMFFARIVGELAAGAVKNERLAGVVYFVVVIVAQIVFGLGGLVITSAFSRRREYRADAGSARLVGRDKMIAALRRLQTVHELVDDSAPAMAALKIAGKRRFAGLTSTHPDLEDRIAALRSAA
jgi:heat shock protein HtpX